MHSVFVCCIDILLLRRDDDFNLILVLPSGRDSSKVVVNFVVTFSTPGDIVHVCELEDQIVLGTLWSRKGKNTRHRR